MVESSGVEMVAAGNHEGPRRTVKYRAGNLWLVALGSLVILGAQNSEAFKAWLVIGVCLVAGCWYGLRGPRRAKRMPPMFRGHRADFGWPR